MFERFWDWCTSDLRRTREIGWALACGAGFLVLLGLMARVLLLAGSMLPTQPSSLAEMGLPFPTFFVPESVVGYFLWLCIATKGAMIVLSVDEIRRRSGMRRDEW